MPGSDSLFREAVISPEPGGMQVGRVVYQSPPMLLGVLASAALFVALLVILTSTRYKETEQAPGVLEPSHPVQRVVAPVAARIVAWHVDEGELVAAGQTLATLSRSVFDQQGSEFSSHAVASLEQQRRLLDADLRLGRDQHEQELAQLEATRADLQREIALMTGDLALIDEQLEIGGRQMRALHTVHATSAGISRREVDQQQLTQLSLKRQRQDAVRLLDRRQADLSRLQERGAAAVTRQQRDQLRLQRDLVRLDQELLRFRQQDRIAVVAEQSGVVSAIQLDAGQPVRANQGIAQIQTPQSPLQVVVFVPSRVAGKLVPGQELLLRFDAFDYHHYGRYGAVVTHIGRASIDPREQLLPVSGINEPVFRLTARLDQHYVEGPDIYPLQAGLALTADFVLQDLSLLSFIFKPVLALRGKVG
ncbi:MAG: HlyD family efflux transporter periplasmic adaptor subunit [Pseudohongiellaceae bacterium]